MDKINFSTILRIFREYGIITIGILLYSFAWAGIIIPADGVGGGASGLALLIYYATGGISGGLSIGIGFFIINAGLLLAAIFILGAKFGAKTIYAIFLISFCMGVFQECIPHDLLGLSGDKLLSSILGGVFSGFGVGMCLLQGGSTGGSDIVAMIVNKYRNVSFSKVVVICDLLVIGGSYVIFKDIPTIIYGYILVATFGFTTDMVLSGSKQSFQLFVMSNKYAEIADGVTNEMRRGVTVLDGTGWYTKRPIKVLMIVCRKTEVSIIMRYIKEQDSNAFISMGDVTGVYGEGFEMYRR